MKLKSYLSKVSLSFLLLLALFGGALFAFAAIAHEVLWEQEEEMDNFIFGLLSRYVIQPQLTPLMKTITYFASSTFLQIAYSLVVLLYLLRKQFRRAFEISAVGLGGFLVNYFMKLSFQRVRPPWPLIEPLQNFSFPSGHATSGFIFYGLLVYLIWKTKWPKAVKYTTGVLLILFSLLIGFSRVYLRVHYPSDVLAGFCIGFAWLTLCIWLMEKLKANKRVDMA